MASKTVVFSNPRKRRTKRKATRRTTAMSARRRNPVKKVTRRVKRRKNPSVRGIADKNLMPAAKGAVGALGLDMAYNLLPIPAEYQTGIVGSIVKGASVIAIGMSLEKIKVLKGPTAKDAVNGALTVQLYTLGQEFIGGMMASGPAPVDTNTGYVTTAQNAGDMGLGLVAPASGYDPVGAGLGMFEDMGAYDHTGV